MSVFEYVWAGVLAVFLGPEAFNILGIGIPITVLIISFSVRHSNRSSSQLVYSILYPG